jgi:histidinol dehydrogenase
MTVTLAAAAGVKEIVVATPSDGRAGERCAAACAADLRCHRDLQGRGGASHSGPCLGTQTIRSVQKIAGPGNAYVVEAKRQVFGEVSIDLLPGPSEVLVIADAAANPSWVAAELLAQAEHGKGSGIVLVTTSAKLLTAVAKQLSEQCEDLSRREHLAGVLERDAFLVLVKSLPDAVRLCNEYAPEHVSVMTQDPGSLAKEIFTAGAIFLGPYSPVAAGDFMAGPSHTLPTGGGGKSFPGLMADMFQRRTSWVKMDEKALRKSLPIIAAFSELEGLDAHARSAAIRLKPLPRKAKPAKTEKPPLPVSRDEGHHPIQDFLPTLTSDAAQLV